MSNLFGRDPETGELVHKLSLDIHIKGQLLPRMVNVRDWATLGEFLDSEDFKAIAGQVEHLNVFNREA